MIKNIISRLTMIKSGKLIYDPIKKELLYYWTDCHFDEYVAKKQIWNKNKNKLIIVTLYQYCDKCKTQTNFDPETLKCKTCNNKNKLIK